MKNVLRYPLFVMLIASMHTGEAVAAEKPSVEKGHQLFNSQSLAGATSGKSCAGCHPAGAGLENAWKNQNLAGQVNTCIAGPLKGLKLNENSIEMQSLIMYIRSLKQQH
ncbi:MAG: cytochrome C [Chlorobium sp.]